MYLARRFGGNIVGSGVKAMFNYSSERGGSDAK